jgi:hypothetical protein
MTAFRPSRLACAALCLIGLALPATAQSYRAINLLYVVPMSSDTFEVLESRGAGAADIWCAAADYARRAGLDAPHQRMFVEGPRGKSRTTANAIGVVFTTNPGEDIRDTGKSYSVSVKRRGENLGVGHAYNFCSDMMFDSLRF